MCRLRCASVSKIDGAWKQTGLLWVQVQCVRAASFSMHRFGFTSRRSCCGWLARPTSSLCSSRTASWQGALCSVKVHAPLSIKPALVTSASRPVRAAHLCCITGFGFDCLGRTVNCPRPPYATIGSGILLGSFGLWLLLITYLLGSAFFALSKLPYAQYRVANLIIRLQVGLLLG